LIDVRFAMTFYVTALLNTECLGSERKKADNSRKTAGNNAAHRRGFEPGAEANRAFVKTSSWAGH
jgi:hypothetical protein